ncbi:hypothetical protein [Yoonia sp. 2307UL14-13]|uniref:hypothetical protein n=1 Tax=Yoonia sp. 2307UL14-13 TaxID=3126506 RepID=UPI0030B56971
MSKLITIRRERGFYAIFRKLNIRVDDQKVMAIKAGETLPLKLPAGAQKLHLQMDWVSTDPLDLATVQDGDTLGIRVEKRSFRDMSRVDTMPFVISIER